jgi:hypothetical protein
VAEPFHERRQPPRNLASPIRHARAPKSERESMPERG